MECWRRSAGRAPASMHSLALAIHSRPRPAKRVPFARSSVRCCAFSSTARTASLWCKISDDMAALMSLGIAKNRIALIPGSGVDVNRFTPLAEPAGAPTFGFVGRLLDDKGIRTLVAAHRLLRRRIPDAQAFDRRHAGPRQSGFGDRGGGEVLERAKPGSPGSAMSTTSPAFGRRRMSRCCRRAARVCRCR